MTVVIKDPEPINIFPVDNYLIQSTSIQPEEDSSVADRMHRLQDQFEETGMRRSVDAVIDHGFPCILTLQVANDFFKLPGGYLDPSEDDEVGMVRHLRDLLNTAGKPQNEQPQWEVRDLLSIWWRPNFDGFFYPYKPAHITIPKERKKIFLVTVPPKISIGVPLNMKLLAIPIHEFYDNTQRYGPQLSAIPHLLSRLTFTAKD